jgi:hypothetical protein
MKYDKPYEAPPNSGSLMASKSKKTEKSPDYWGDITLDVSKLGLPNGKGKVRISGWKRQSKTGSTFLSLQLAPMQEQQDFPKENKKEEIEDDDIPF